MNVCFELFGGMFAVFYENRSGIKKSVISFVDFVFSEYRHEIP